MTDNEMDAVQVGTLDLNMLDELETATSELEDRLDRVSLWRRRSDLDAGGRVRLVGFWTEVLGLLELGARCARDELDVLASLELELGSSDNG